MFDHLCLTAVAAGPGEKYRQPCGGDEAALEADNTAASEATATRDDAVVGATFLSFEVQLVQRRQFSSQSPPADARAPPVKLER